MRLLLCRRWFNQTRPDYDTPCTVFPHSVTTSAPVSALFHARAPKNVKASFKLSRALRGLLIETSAIPKSRVTTLNCRGISRDCQALWFELPFVGTSSPFYATKRQILMYYPGGRSGMCVSISPFCLFLGRNLHHQESETHEEHCIACTCLYSFRSFSIGMQEGERDGFERIIQCRPCPMMRYFR